jgi:hypothetical protein
MAKIICICSREPGGHALLEARIARLNRRLTPDNITPNPAAIHEGTGVTTAVLNPTLEFSTRGASVCLGLMIEPGEDWWRPGAPIPDGACTLFRADPAAVELVNDVVGSRTVWFVQTDDVFIASTSQRAIVCLLESFEPNEMVIPWMLSCGQLGPDNSYDARIRSMRPNSRVLLDRRSWTLATEELGNEIEPVERSRKEHEEGLRHAVERAFGGLGIDASRWILPLSGGVDSRAILYWLEGRDKLRAVTWGVRSALEDRGNDAAIAARVARHYRLNHRFLETDLSDEPVEKLFERFFVAGEGRVDSIAGYTDGFKIWMGLFEEGAAGVLRGDECFGLKSPAFTELGARRYLNCLFLSDYANLPRSISARFSGQRLPVHLERRDGESILRWRDRLYYNFRMPFVMAALTDLKCSYVEVLNPFLTRSIVDYMRTVPDELRSKKRLFSDVIADLDPPIPHAERAAIDTSFDVFRSKSVAGMIECEMASERAAGIFPDAVIGFARESMRRREAEGPARSETHAKYRVPAPIRRTLGGLTQKPRGLLRDRYRKPVLDANLLAVRVFVVSRMHALLGEDANAFRGD